MYISAKVDYATRALLTLAAADAERPGSSLKGEAVAESQKLPTKYVENILVDLRRAGFVSAQRGAVGGYRLARDPSDIAIADVIRALEGPLAEVRGERPEKMRYDGPAEHLQSVWIAVRAALRSVLEKVTIADVLAGTFPPEVSRFVEDPDSWKVRT
ncbi:MAG TPA: Rrf2 family transcriptional regulator [Acidimicrobiales bacterium]|nr:Rrf2 family transcriptional regulator [Acidimicrobiales bacterium]